MSKRVVLTKQEQLTLQIMEDLHKHWSPHDGQIAVGRPLINGDITDTIFCQNGRKWGKDIALDEPVLTPDGFKPIEDIHVGDIVISGKGLPTKVTIESPIYTDHKCYTVKFQDGTEIIAGEDHKWEVGNKNGTFKVLQTKELNKNWYRTKLPVVQGTKQDLVLKPYLLGLWLGDGTSADGSFTTVDLELLDAFYEDFEPGFISGITYGVKGLKVLLRTIGVLNNKHIPFNYMNSSVEDRAALLKGLMDTDGTVDNRGVCEFVQKNKRLFDDVVDLARSLGIRVHVIKPKEIEGTLYYRLKMSPNRQVFSLERKAERLEPHVDNIRRKYKNIISVEPCETVDTKCIGVDCESHTFITRNYTVTHNTEFVVYLLWRHALLNPGSACYYVCPELSHGRDLVWANDRLQNFLGHQDSKKYVRTAKNQEMRVEFKNGSFIKVWGSENFQAANGLTPDFAVYDEFKAFHPRFHTTFNPNRLSKGAPLVIIGTPPTVGDRNREEYMDVAEDCKKDSECLWVRRTSYDNPYIPHKVLERERAKLFRRSEEEVWYREYEGKIVSGGASAIFPMFDPHKHVKSQKEMLEELRYDMPKMEWHLVADPGSTTCFGVLLAAIHPYNRKVYILAEMYETDQYRTSVREMFPRMKILANKLHPYGDLDNDWHKTFDEAAAWFSLEVMNQYGVYFAPTQKHLHKKEYGLSLIKDQLIHEMVTISSECENLIREMENYARDEKGNIPKVNDHLIDCFRYMNAASNYSMVEALEVKMNQTGRGMKRIGEDLDDFERDSDWMTDVMGGWND